MIDTALALVADYGAVIVAICAYFSCLLVPIPTSLVMLSAGWFVAAGDLDGVSVWAATWAAAVAGDQTGYWIGRTAGARVLPKLANTAARAALLARAETYVDRHGGLGVFLSTWLFAPLGPWVNLVAGATGLGWLRYTIADVTGEFVWVSLYMSLGYLFGDRLDQISYLLGNTTGFLLAGLAALVLGTVLWRRLRGQNRTKG